LLEAPFEEATSILFNKRSLIMCEQLSMCTKDLRGNSWGSKMKSQNDTHANKQPVTSHKTFQGGNNVHCM